ncbi:MAG TPA: TrkA family potassium uptake protein [Bacillus sp. (in: firmicutes)]|nr:TrkA family potassium uptake protein [Bacillus sp. (in: firmicutes)]
MKKQFAVLGLGRFGGTLVEELSKLNVEVLAVDRNEEVVNKYANMATYVVQSNVNDESDLKAMGIDNVDHAIVSFGENIETSILATLLLKEMGIKQVWVKAANHYHQKVLEKIGADRVIHPERDMARRIAHHVVSEKIIDYIELSPDYSMVEIIASDELHNKSLLDLDVRAKYGCNIIGIQRGDDMIVSPSAEEVILERDKLLVIGHNQDLTRFEEQGV